MSESSTKTPPSRFGRYRIFSKVAAGGMATVYLARTEHESGFEKIVALKVIHDHLVEEKSFVDMFLDEARLAAGITHPNVCTVFDFGEQDGIYYLAMEFLLGEPIKRVIRSIAKRKDKEQIKRLPWYVARLIAEACEGLHAAHELCGANGERLGVVHRDVSPENIVVTYDGAVKIVDFGVAKAAERIHQTKVSKIKGKFAYVAPEQIRNEEVDRRADVWGLGVCLWEALTLRRLFRRDSDAATLSAVVFDDVPAPSEVSPWVPPALDTIVLRALARDRNQRYRTARAMGQDLRKFLTSTGMTIGTAEVSEWMAQLFPEEREARMALVQQARQGKPSDSFPAITHAEGSVPEGTLPSVSVLVSPEEAAALRIGISLDEFADLALEYGERCSPEIAGIIAMDVCDGMHDRPALITAGQIRLTEEGRVSLAKPLDAARASDAARSIISAFKILPMQDGPVTQMLRSAEYRSPDELNAALQKAIDPMALGQARKALVRMVLMKHGPATIPPKSRAVVVDPLVKYAEDSTGSNPLHVPFDPAAHDLPDPDELVRSMKGNGARNFMIVLGLLGAATAALAITQPEMVRGWLGMQTQEPEPEPEPEPIVQEPILGRAVIRIATEDARVLMFVGRAPINVPNVSVGGHNILAIQAGRPDTWGVVPDDGVWTDGDEPRYELAIQIPEEGETAEIPAMPVNPDQEHTGTLRVITTPPGAKIFRVVGSSPEVTITDLDTDQVVELLVLREGYETHRELVTSSRWGDPERPHVEIDVELREVRRRHRHRRRRRPAMEATEREEPAQMAEESAELPTTL